MQQIISHQHNLCFDLVSQPTNQPSTAAWPFHANTSARAALTAPASLLSLCMWQCLKEFSSPSLASAESRCLTACFHRYEDARQAAINTLKDKMQSAKR